MEIKPCEKHTKFGNFLFTLCAKWTVFLSKHRWLYYVLALTWGLPLTLIGFIVTFALWIFKLFKWKKVRFESYLWIYSIKIGDFWGGFETGLMFVRDWLSSEYLSYHEFGHSFQNCLFGPFQLVWSLGSAIRYWYRKLKYENRGKIPPTNYDSYWLEDSATQCGKYLKKYLK